MLLDDIEKNYPYISVVEYGGQEYVGVINNQDNAITSMFIFTDIRSAENKEKFIGQKVVLVITGGNVDLVSLPWLKVGKD